MSHAFCYDDTLSKMFELQKYVSWVCGCVSTKTMYTFYIQIQKFTFYSISYHG